MRRRHAHVLAGLALGIGFLPGLVSEVQAQEAAQQPAIIDTIIIRRDNVFNEEEAAGAGAFRVMNKLHIVTKERVIRNYLQFEVGEPFDSAAVAESERQLRLKRIFREMSIDTTRLEDGRLAVVVHSQDGWSLKPKVKFSIATA
jgi:outer membrane translocation and assembly module TamA